MQNDATAFDYRELAQLAAFILRKNLEDLQREADRKPSTGSGDATAGEIRTLAMVMTLVGNLSTACVTALSAAHPEYFSLTDEDGEPASPIVKRSA